MRLAVVSLSIVVALGTPSPAQEKRDPREHVKRTAIVQLERRAELVLADVGRVAGLDEKTVAKLRRAMHMAIAAHVEDNPPPVPDAWDVPYDPDLEPVLEHALWLTVYEGEVDADRRLRVETRRQERLRELDVAATAFVEVLVSAQLGLTREQTEHLGAVFESVARARLDAASNHGSPSLARLVAKEDKQGERILTKRQRRFIESKEPSQRRLRDDCILEAEYMRLVCGLTEAQARLLEGCAVKLDGGDVNLRVGRYWGSLGTGLPKPKNLENPFWKKLLKTMLSDDQRRQLAASRGDFEAEIAAARLRLGIAQLDERFILTEAQREAVRPLLVRIIDRELSKNRRLTLAALEPLGLRPPRTGVIHRGVNLTAEQKGNRAALRDILDPAQRATYDDQVR